jgi:hypothetical protein
MMWKFGRKVEGGSTHKLMIGGGGGGGGGVQGQITSNLNLFTRHFPLNEGKAKNGVHV